MPNLEKLARRIVETCLAVQPGEHVHFIGGAHQFKLLAKLAVHARRVGAWPHLTVKNDEMAVRMYTDVPEEYQFQPLTAHEQYAAKLYDAVLFIDALQDQTCVRDVPSELMAKTDARNKPLREMAYARKRRAIPMGWPTKDRAKNAGLTMTELSRIFWQAVDFDLEAMMRLSRPLEGLMEKAKRGHITSRKGTDLTFRMGGRRVMIDAGHFTPEMVARGDLVKNLPCGEVYTTLHEETTEGTAVFDEVYLKGQKVKNLRLTFKKGRIVACDADKNLKLFTSLWDRATGDRDRIGEFAIGTNPAVTRPIGDPLFDEKIFGSVHLALGEDRMYGGTNDSSIHWDFVILKPTVELDGRRILDAGKFTLDR